MSLTIDLADESQLQLDKADITVLEESIQFSLEGEIEDLSKDVIEEYDGESLLPTEITFDRR